MSSEPSLRYVLYVVRGEFNSDLAVAQTTASPEHLHIQDVRHLTAEGIAIPEWLSGVPTLVNVGTGELYRGGSAVQKLFQLGLGPNREAALETAFKTASETAFATASHSKQPATLPPDTEVPNHSTGAVPPSADDEFAPLVDPSDVSDEAAVDEKKVNMDDINKQLAMRGIGANEGGNEAATQQTTQ